MGTYGYYDYSYGQPSSDAAIAGLGGFLLVFVLLFYLLMIAFWVVHYVLYSLGTYTIAKRRGIHNPWLAWVPVGSAWLLGSISDQYQYVAKGRVRNRRKVLLGLSIGICATVVVMFVSMFAAIFGEATGTAAGDTVFGAGIAIVLICYLAVLVLSIVFIVFQYMALYDLFASCDSGNAVLYLVLTILLGVVLPFFVFACRKKDGGMPPRRSAQPVQAMPMSVEQQPDAVAEEPVAEAAGGVTAAEEPEQENCV